LFKKIARSGAALVAPLSWRLYLRKNKKEWPRGARCAVTFSFDYDYVSDVMCVRDLCEAFNSHGLTASHAVVGKYVEAFPRDHALLVDAGHELINHSYSHPDGPLNHSERFNELSPKRLEEEVAGCEHACKKALGVKPVGFRAPHFGLLNTQKIYEILDKRKYLYSSSTNLTTTQSHGTPYHPNKQDFHKAGAPHYRVLELPLFACPTHYYPVFDSWHCFETGAHAREGQFKGLFSRALHLAEKYGAHLNLYFDPHHVAHLREFNAVLEEAARSRAWVASSREVAEWWRK